MDAPDPRTTPSVPVPVPVPERRGSGLAFIVGVIAAGVVLCMMLAVWLRD